MSEPCEPPEDTEAARLLESVFRHKATMEEVIPQVLALKGWDQARIDLNLSLLGSIMFPPKGMFEDEEEG
ncbi:hypothetical protein [Haloferula sp.]|uniref:hypothetical protein n=1 Tax=Haloferula sp. TaxID=2497595 RepID=UPI00329EB936